MHAFGSAGWAKMIDKVAMDAFALHGTDGYKIQIVPIGDGHTGREVSTATCDGPANAPTLQSAATLQPKSSHLSASMLRGPRSDATEFMAAAETPGSPQNGQGL